MSKKYYDAQTVEAVAKENWNKDPALREEFSDFNIFHAYCRAVASGSVRIQGSRGERDD